METDIVVKTARYIPTFCNIYRIRARYPRVIRVAKTTTTTFRFSFYKCDFNIILPLVHKLTITHRPKSE